VRTGIFGDEVFEGGPRRCHPKGWELRLVRPKKDTNRRATIENGVARQKDYGSGKASEGRGKSF